MRDMIGAEGFRLSRRSVISAALAAAGGAQAFGQAAAPPTTAKAPANSAPAKRYDMRKSINLWAFPYPDKMSLEHCLQLAHDAGFDAIELNYDLDNDLSPKSGTKEFTAIRKMAERIGIEISGVCSFLFWPYPMTSNDPAIRARSLELGTKMIDAAHDLGTENLLVVPGAVTIPWRTDYEPVPNDVCEERAIEAVRKLVPHAEKQKVNLNIENIFFNGFLMTPDEMNSFVDCFESERVRVHFDTGNIMLFQYPEHWIPILGARIQNVHLKEFTKKGTDHSLESFRPLLDGTTNWPAVMDEFQTLGYRGYLTFEYFHPYEHYPEALIYQTSDSLDRLLGRKPGCA
ncbi:MAG TPA: sugar phosphate isomerase/epimerase family protein [Pirellulales bacterium]|nr:sugar phosphate isomerase/epimerase family protein [Pirellulales bacterium]